VLTLRAAAGRIALITGVRKLSAVDLSSLSRTSGGLQPPGGYRATRPGMTGWEEAGVSGRLFGDGFI